MSASRNSNFIQLFRTVALSILLFWFPTQIWAASLKVQSAQYEQSILTVIASYQGKTLPTDGLVHLNDRKLGSSIASLTLADIPATKNKRKMTFKLTALADIPCAIRLSADNAPSRDRTVKGAPKKACSLGAVTSSGATPTSGSGAPAPSNGTPSPSATGTVPAGSASTPQQSGDSRERNRDPDPLPPYQPPAPKCEIISPSSNTKLTANQPVEFHGKVSALNPKANPLTYEWDFAGGVMGHPTGTLSGSGELRTSATFVRDNSNYRVRLSAIDQAGSRCEAAIEVSVGTPPVGLPPKVAEQPAPSVASGLKGGAGSLTVLPFQEWTMQHFTDMRVLPNGYVSFDALTNTLNAHVFEKGSVGEAKPKFASNENLVLQYSSASNPVDPVGAYSINSTSQNWPLSSDPSKPAPLMKSTVQKADMWETDFRPPEADLWVRYVSQPWLEMTAGDTWIAALPGLPRPDEGYFPHVTKDCSVWGTVAEWALYSEQTEEGLQDTCKAYNDSGDKRLALQPPGATHGQYMPGVNNPYVSNDPQPLPKYDGDRQWFSAPLLPMTDVTDDGRVNAYPLLRVEAKRKGSQMVEAKTDGVLSNSRDFHCRECHAKGQIGANPNAGYKKEAFRSSAYGKTTLEGMDDHTDGTMPEHLERPAFFSVEDIGGNPNNLFDQEYAAALNYSSTHQYYDGMGFLDHMQKGGINEKSGLIGNDWAAPCYGCHMSIMHQVISGEDWWSGESYDYSVKSYDPNYSLAMHRFHAEMQYNADKTDIVRNEKGAYARFDWKNKTREPDKDINPNSLFPIFGPDGKQLPMEQNCLKCHAGQREQMYDDRMKTAGVTCYDCHGDMLAVGQAFPKDPGKAGSIKHHDYRNPWFDETDCGSCHVGTAKAGNTAQGDFFSAGIRKRAFDDTDLAANSRVVDHADPDAVRFAVVPNYVKEFKTSATRHEPNTAGADEDGNITDTNPTKIDAPVYRFGKDQHAGIACSACHGAAHMVGPNRDPNANINVTPTQLQGYAGPVMECRVCHTDDAFAGRESVGSVLHYPDKNGGASILAGPHNLHPVNDKTWWWDAEGEIGGRGGWHADYAQKPGLKGEDQCAACHGSDHLGTRLAKTTIDREFTDESGRPISIKAGTPVSCEVCHSIKKSCKGSPNPTCGAGT